MTDPQSLRLVGQLLVRDPRSLRFARPWLRSLSGHHHPVADRRPWIPFRARAWLEAHLRPDMSVFEYGSGGSTLFFAPRVRQLVSIEHDEEWHAQVAVALAADGVENCTHVLHKAEPLRGAVPREYGLTSCTSARDDYAGTCFESYVSAIDSYPDQSFDVVVVDGRARLSCVERSLSKVKPGGYLVLDNSERAEYAPAFTRLASHPRTDFFGFAPYRTYQWQLSTWQIRPGQG